MVFSSNIFLFLFLPVTLAGNFLLPKKARNVFLLIASLLFYAWGEPRVVLVMIASILFNYGMGLLVDRFCIQRKSAAPLRYLLLILAVGGNLGLLFYYKYYDFFFQNVNSLLGTSVPLKPHSPAHRHLLLHLPGPELRSGRLPRRHARPTARWRRWRCISPSSRSSSPDPSCAIQTSPWT